MRWRARGCRSRSSRNTAAKREPCSGFVHPTISLWSSSGSSWAKAWILAFSLSWVFHAVGDGGGQAGAGDQRDRLVQGLRQLLGQAVIGALGTPLRHQLLGMGGRDVDLRAHARPGAAQRRHFERGDHHVGDGGAGLVAARHGDDRHAVLPGQLGQPPAGRGDDPGRAERAGGLVAGEGLLGVARVAAAQHGRVGRGPGRQLVAARQADRPRHAVAQRRAGERPADSRAAHARPRSGRPGHRRAGSARSRSSTARRAAARAAP